MKSYKAISKRSLFFAFLLFGSVYILFAQNTGDKVVMVGDTSTYTNEFKKPQATDSLYWKVTGGDIISSNKESVTVRWTEEGVGSVVLYFCLPSIKLDKEIQNTAVLVKPSDR